MLDKANNYDHMNINNLKKPKNHIKKNSPFMK